MDDIVYERTKEQRDHWKEMADIYKAQAARAEEIILQIDVRMGHGWTKQLAEALTPAQREAK